MTGSAFFIIGGAIFLTLGTLHLLFTFVTDNFNPRDPSVRSAMEGTSIVLTRRTTLWDAWVGFNGSHSLGAMLLGGIYILLAWRHPELLASDPLVGWLPSAFGLAYVALAVKYWFRIPLTGTIIATACFVTGAALI